jgi:hypothetical protein
MHYEKLSEDDYINCLKTIKAIDYKENMLNLISFEGFTQLNFKINQELIFKRLKNLFTDCNFKLKVFIIIRNQISIIPSHYANTPRIYISSGLKFCNSFKNFINNIGEMKKTNEKNYINSYDRYKYFQLHQLLIKILSKENVNFF